MKATGIVRRVDDLEWRYIFLHEENHSGAGNLLRYGFVFVYGKI